MGMCKILGLRWSCVYCLGPYMGTVTSGPKMGTCKILGPRWSCVYCLGPYMDTVTSGPKMGTCKIWVPRWSCVYCHGPYMGTVTSGPMMGMCKILGPRWSCVCCLGPYLGTVTLDLSRTHQGNNLTLKKFWSHDGNTKLTPSKLDETLPQCRFLSIFSLKNYRPLKFC